MLILVNFSGRQRNEEERQLLNIWTVDNSNVEYRDHLSEEEMASLYSHTNLSALSSKNIGVGILALDAAAMDCDVVMTSLEGPKDYCGGKEKIAALRSIGDLGGVVVQVIDDETLQPHISEFTCANYSLQPPAKKQVSAYETVV